MSKMSANPHTGVLDPSVCRVSVRKVRVPAKYGAHVSCSFYQMNDDDDDDESDKEFQPRTERYGVEVYGHV